jgi:taurine dioxygenase
MKPSTKIVVKPVSPYVGAEIQNVDIASGLSDAQFADIRQAYIDHGVIFFRDQNLTPEQHIEFAGRWGEINQNRFFGSVEGYPLIAEVRKEAHNKKNIGGKWHTDHSYDQIPAMGSVLYAREVPSLGGDTLFASMYAAYEYLSDGLKSCLEGLNAVHSSRHAFGPDAYSAEDLKEYAGRLSNVTMATQDSIHPVVIRHPLSGKPALYVNKDFTVKFEGWTIEESQPLLDLLYHRAQQAEFTCRFKWEKGSVAIWDNRATHHFALNDYAGHFRLMHRITIEGEALFAA